MTDSKVSASSSGDCAILAGPFGSLHPRPWDRWQRQLPTGTPLAAISDEIHSTAHGSRRRSSKLTNGNVEFPPEPPVDENR